MNKGKHESVSSEERLKKEMKHEDGETKDPYESVSSESETIVLETGIDQVAESFDGTHVSGEIEAVTGFDASRALTEGMPPAFITKELLELGEVHPEGMEPESVCGNDDRVRISPTTSIPWRWICKLIVTLANGQMSGCTGWFIGPKTVMTAGHCVFNKGAGGWPQKIEVIPAMDGAIRPYNFLNNNIGTSFRSVVGWTQNSDFNYDYGAIILPNNTLGNYLGYFGFASLTDASLQNLLVNNSGYPGDKPFGTQWFNAGRITSVEARSIYYMIDTIGGQSGSPVWRFLNDQRHAVGVHAYGGCPNHATRIIAPVYNNMLAWRNL